MTRIIVERRIAAPVETVFRAVTDIEKLPETNPDILRVEFLSDSRSGVGARFRETRRQGGQEAVTELEVTEWIENKHARMVADSHGTVWDTVFTVRPAGDQDATLRVEMDARAHKLLPKLMNPLLKGLFKKGVEKHVDALQAYCEGHAADNSS